MSKVQNLNGPGKIKTSAGPGFDSAFRKHVINSDLIQADWLGRIRDPNGKDHKITVKQVWELYRRDHLPTVTESTRVNKEFRCGKFLQPLFEIRMCELSPQLISEFIRFKLNLEKAEPSKRRFNFSKELRDLKSISRWYADHIDFQYANPIKQHHYKLSVVKEIPKREREMTLDQYQLFLSHLPGFYRSLAQTQYLTATRVGEAAGLQWKNVDFERRLITIQEIIVWIKGKPKVKSCPKNGKRKVGYMCDALFAILQERLKVRNGSDFVFHKNGKPLSYSVINANCNRAWKRAGLTQFRSTHQSRYVAAQQARLLTGGLNGVKAVTGQGTQMAQKYSDYTSIDENRSTIEKMEEALFGKKIAS